MNQQTGLAPGQAWAVAAGPTWQARIDRAGRAHVIGWALADHATYAVGYLDPRRIFAGIPAGPLRYEWQGCGVEIPFALRPRPWHTFERACRAARMHERMVLAAKRTEQGGDA